MALFFCLWVCVIATRLTWLQIIRHHHYVEEAARQQQRTFEVAPRRGMLYDRDLRELAMTVMVDSIYAVPSEMGDSRDAEAEILSQIVHSAPDDNFTSEQQMQARFDDSRNFAWVARRVDDDTSQRVRELAMTVMVDSVYAVPSEMGDSRDAEAAILSQIVHSDPDDNFTSEQQIQARFDDSRNFAWVARRVDDETSQRVRELNLKGVYFQKEFKRFYPNNGLAAQVLGYVGTDDNGLGGLELKFDDDLHGTPGHMLTALDAKRRVLGSEESDPQPGENLVLSIDANIQYMAEKALDDQMAKEKALHGTIVVMDPHTGQILALAVSPRFNPNDSRHMDPDALTDLAVSDVYEPGSTFKLVTYAAALDAAGVEPTDMVNCENGAMTMYGRTLHDDKGDHFSNVTVQYALEQSSDVGAAKMALKVGQERFYQYIKGFGFGSRTGIELPSETRGLLRPPRNWDATSILSLAIGQEIGVTPVQLAAMVSTIANGGTYIPPHILLQSTDEQKGVQYPDGGLQPAAFHPENELPTHLPEGSRRVISEMTAAKMRKMMEGIVLEGTGKGAALNGYSAGGKTGTAQKIDVVTHTYSKSLHVASFAGMAPVSDPAITVAVVIDSPTVGSYYGAQVSAPVFQAVAQQVLEYLGVPHDQPVRTQKQMLAATATAAKDGFGDGSSEETGDLNAMFAQANELPADDPLRVAMSAGQPAPVQANVQPGAPPAPPAP
ncbi:MAG TPA: penicillin-binding protein 2, partial [Acidobacteriaceae bacterium]|nr:penicillin-binding protein 2 [Acidobacteriaceae bacterium]